MPERRVARLSFFVIALLVIAAAALADDLFFDTPQRLRPRRAPITIEQLLLRDLHAQADAGGIENAAGEASVTDPTGDLNAYFIDALEHPRAGNTVSDTLPGDFVSGASFDLVQGGCNAFAGAAYDPDYFAWQKGSNASGGSVVLGSLSGTQNVTWSVTHSSIATPSVRQTAGISCARLTPDFLDYEEYYQFSIEHTGQGLWHSYYFWLGSFDFSDGRFDQFELPMADITALSAAETSGGELELSVTVAGGIPAAESTIRPWFLLYAKPATQPLGRYVAIESRAGVWKGILYDYTGSYPIGRDVRTDLPVSIAGSTATVRVNTGDLLLTGSNAAITAQAFTEISALGEIFRGRADLASASLQLTEVTLGRLPDAMLQAANTAGATTEFSLVNNGANPATISIAASGSFFTVSSSSVAIPAGEGAVVTLTGAAVAAGEYNGSVNLSGPGLTAGTSVPVRLLSVAPPAQPPLPRSPIRQDEAQPPAVTSFESGIEVTNDGLGTLSGVLSSDVPWIIPQSAPVSIAPGATGTLSYTIDRSRRLYGNQPGSSSGSLSLAYLSGSPGARSPLGGSGMSISTVAVIDTVKPPTAPKSIDPLGLDEIAMFIPGAEASATGWITDINISPGSSTIPELSIFFLPEGGSTTAATLTNVAAGVPISLADAVDTVFDQQAVGTFVLRGSSSLATLQISALTQNAGAAGTIGATIPVLRSDRGARADEKLQITGLAGRSSSGRTDLFLQEVAGFPVTVTVDFLNLAGQSVETSQKTLGAFSMLRLPDAAPAGAVTAVVAVATGSEGAVSGYAMSVDLVGGDRWVSSDWPRVQGYAKTSVVVIPVSGSITGINGKLFRTDLWLHNPGDAPVTATLSFTADTASGSPTTRDVTINPKETKPYPNVIQSLFEISGRALGFIRIDPKGAALLSSSRTYTSAGAGSANYGMGVPSVAVSASIKRNGTRRISAIEDSAPEIFLARTPGTFRTNLGLVETGGAPATVVVTLNYEYAKSGSLAAARASRSKTYELAPNSFRLLLSLSQEMLGDLRSTLDTSIRSMSIDVKVIAGTGTVETFATAVDNASGDQQFKME